MKKGWRVVLDKLKSVKDAIQDEIEKEKEKLLQSNESEGIRFFLDSISDDIKEMIRLGFNYKHQLKIINRSANKDIKYSTYLRYIKKHLKGASKRNINATTSSRDRVRFKHEAMPNPDELY